MPQLRPQALFAIGVIHARRNESAEALATFQQLRATGSFDMDQLETDARLAELRKDPRFRQLMPKPSDFDSGRDGKELLTLTGESPATDSASASRMPATSTATVAPISSSAHGSTRAARHRQERSISTREKPGR